MGLFQKACETYAANAARVGVACEGEMALCPIAHIVQKAQIEIELRRNGHFLEAHIVPKQDSSTIIPATEKSAVRTSGTAAHPLCDKLCYLAGYDAEKHADYLRQLRSWMESCSAHPMLRSVYEYICGGTILSDLSKAGVIRCREDGRPADGKIEGISYDNCLVRWRVLGDTNGSSACWKNQELFRSFQIYWDTQQGGSSRGLCMLDGVEAVLAENHDKGVVPFNNGAKLISSNDSQGFTYRGRFTASEQAASVGYRASQMAHKALRWVVTNQGIMMGGRCFVCWNPQGKEVYNPMKILRPGGGEMPPIMEPTKYRQELGRTLAGYRQALPEGQGVVLAAFDAATTGRLSLTYYNELLGSDFYDRVQAWYESCCWPHRYYGIQSPSLKQIITCAFGTERGGKKGVRIEADDAVFKMHIQQLFHCIVDRVAVPQDIAMALVRKASQPLNYASENRERVLFTACAVIRKYRNERAKGEEWTMALNTKKQDRSYQYGRLLAVMEKIERDTYKKDENREPNAIRMQSLFCDRPEYATGILQLNLLPYLAKLQPYERAFFRNLMGEIFEMLDCCGEEALNSPLKDSYLMGYYLQRSRLYKSNKKEKMEEDEDVCTEE